MEGCGAGGPEQSPFIGKGQQCGKWLALIGAGGVNEGQREPDESDEGGGLRT